MRTATLLVPALIVAVTSLALGSGQEECTTAVVTAVATPDGHPLLWKNRDTGELSNKAVHVAEDPYSYVAVTNAEEPSGRIVWGGLNERGFAIINSVAYNLPRRGGEMADLEGMVMADALRTCATIQDFEDYIARNLGPGLGCWTNFLVLDAEGGAAIFEVHNHGFVRLASDTAARGYVLNTNFSRSGAPMAGEGYLRFQREEELFGQQSPGTISVRFLLQDVARDLGHVLLENPPRESWSSFPADVPHWLHTRHTIDRNITASSILIRGVRKGEDPKHATLWVILGEPLCSVAVPVWVAAGATPPELSQGEDAPIVQESRRLRARLRPLRGGAREEYLDLTKLDNREGTGWLPETLVAERSIIQETNQFLRTQPGAEAMAAFERAMAERALKTLKAIP